MRARTIGAAVSGAALLCGSGLPAHAATKPKPKPPLCNLVTDPAGDVLNGNQTLDIKSADINSDGKTITVAIRLAKVSTATNPLSPTGTFYQFAFGYDGVGNSVAGYVDPTGKVAYQGTGKITLDAAKNEVRLTQKVDDLTGHPTFKKGGLITNIVVRADLYNATGTSIAVTLAFVGDSASVTKPYVVGTPSCVKLGS